MPKSLQTWAKGYLQDVRKALTKTEAEAAFDFLVQAYVTKYKKVVERLGKDWDRPTAGYYFPAKIWQHLCHRLPQDCENPGMPWSQDVPRHGLDILPRYTSALAVSEAVERLRIVHYCIYKN